MNYYLFKEKKPFRLLFSLIVLVMLGSCTKEFEEPQENLKELLTTVSEDYAVAEGSSITFTDLSLGVEGRKWTFPGGTPETSTAAAANVVFSSESTASILVNPTLEITYFDGTTETETFDITVYPVLVADFTASSEKIKVGESVTFTNASIGGGDSFLWEFEGASPSVATSTDQNPTVTFNGNDPVTVRLSVTRELDESTVITEKVAIVQVGPYELLYNGSFEDQVITGWQTWNGGGVPMTLESDGANGTNYSASLEWTAGTEFMTRDKPEENKVALENGKSYTVSVWLKASNPGVLSIGWFQLGNNYNFQGYSSVWGTNGQVLTEQWQKVEFVANIPDDGTARLSSYPNWYIGKVSEANVPPGTKVYFDEASLKIVEN